MYPSSRRFRCDLDTFPVCRVVNRVIREDTRKDSMYIDTALKDEEDKKDLGGRTHTDDEGVYGHSMTRHDGRGRRLDFVPSVCKRRGESDSRPPLGLSLPPLLDLIMHDGQPSRPLLCQPTSHENLRDTTSTAPPPVMNDDDAPPPEGRSDDRPATPPKPSHNEAQKEFRITASYYGSSARLEVPHHVWVGATVLSLLNMFHSDFLRVFFEHFRALLEEANDEAYVCRLPDYVRWIRSMYMFVRVERPRGSKRFVLGYVKCDWAFSFALRLEQMRLRLNCIPPVVLTKVEVEENKALRLACVGETDYERALAKHSDTRVDGTLLTPLSAAIYGKDEESAMVLLDGGDDPNEVDGNGMNALHRAAVKGCRPPLFQRVVARIHDVNTVDNDGWTALMFAAWHNHLDVVISLMNHPRIDLNVQNCYNNTALHRAVRYNHPAIVSQLLSDDKNRWMLVSKIENRTALTLAVDRGAF